MRCPLQLAYERKQAIACGVHGESILLVNWPLCYNLISAGNWLWVNHLKMLSLHLYTFIIGHKSCNMLGILKQLHCKRNCKVSCQIMCFRHKSKNTTTTTTRHKIKHKTPCRSRELNSGTLAPKADALPLHHRVNR